jgi:oxygen-dependent protoporphyrinogen oxidase
MSSASLKVAVIGGGITGLTAAFRLHQAGAQVRLFEASSRLGGAVNSTRDGDWLIESGPNSIQESSADLTDLIREIGLDPHRATARPEAKNRYILRHGVPVAAPTSPPGIINSRLFSIGAKLRLFAEVLKRPKIRPAEISLADFIRDHFGDEIVDYGLNPFVSGVYAGNPETLSARHAFPSLWQIERETGSIIRGQIKAAKAKRARGEPAGPPPIISFREGLGMLPAALTESLPSDAIELNARVKGLTPGKKWNVSWQRDTEPHVDSFDRVVLALPAPALARLNIGSLGERPLAELADINYPAVASLFLGYRRDQIAHPLDGFGLLVPQVEHRQLLGVLFSSSLFTGRAPTDHVALTVMFGGVHRRDLGEAPLETLLNIARRELAEILGVKGEPVFSRSQNWPHAIPQYELGYGRFLTAMSRCETQHPGLFLGGHTRDGIALTACIKSGEKLAKRALGSSLT